MIRLLEQILGSSKNLLVAFGTFLINMASKPTGSYYRKRKAEAEKVAQQSSISKYFQPEVNKRQGENPSEILNINELGERSVIVEGVGSDIVSELGENSSDILNTNIRSDTVEVINADILNESMVQLPSTSCENSFYKYRDVGTWPIVISSIRDEIVLHGPEKTEGPDSRFPKTRESKTNKERHFSIQHFERRLPNGEVIKRLWLQYSESKDKVYCFCCKLFSTKVKSKFGGEGVSDWKHLAEYLKSHESSTDHIQSYTQWRQSEKCLKKCEGVDRKLQLQIQAETKHWQNVLERIVDIIQFLAQNDLPFRGSVDKLFKRNNGNFLGLVQLLGKYDAVMREHINRIKTKETSVTYLSNNIQNELIEQLGNQTKEVILKNAKHAKYFSIIVDCTPDISRIEQTSLTLRFLDINSTVIEIKEHFICFFPVIDTTGSGLTDVILDQIKKCGLDMGNCRGQGYDNGPNMSGRIKGVQNRILEKYPRAFFNPCACHSLNLVVGDASKSSLKSTGLFGVVQRLYVLASASTKRWRVFETHLSSLTIKEVCETRWECKINALKSVRYQLEEILEALEELETESTEDKLSSEAKSLVCHISDIEFIITLILWYDILFQINIVSKSMQSENIDFAETLTLLNNCLQFFQKYRHDGYIDAKIKATEICEELGIERNFKERRVRRTKRQFDYECSDEKPTDPEELFKIEVFYPLIDTVTEALKKRFALFNEHNKIWSFLYDIQSLEAGDLLKENCRRLEKLLKIESTSDINAELLRDELIHFQSLIKGSEVHTPVQVINYLKKMELEDCFINVWIALRILVTIPITVASGERSFSTLKRIKTYLRSTMTQQRLTALGILSIESEVADSLDWGETIKTFAAAKTRKTAFVY